MPETTFGVTYDGSALATGRMPVRDLAPALLGLGQIFTDASRLIYPDRPPVGLSIKANEGGSFVVHLVLEAESVWDQVVELFTSPDITALLALQALVAGPLGVFWLVKRIGGRRIEKVVPGETVTITLVDGEVIEAPAGVLELYRNMPIRRNAADVVAPLAKSGVDRLDFWTEEGITVQLSTDDMSAFDATGESIPLNEQESTMVVEIASVAFTDGNKWRLSNGDQKFYAEIHDEGFLGRINDGSESFRKGDRLDVQMRIVQSDRIDGLHTEHHVMKVNTHIARQIQMRIPD